MHYPQLFLRLALAFSFSSAVADRFGFWGDFGSPMVVWGNWSNFLTYSNSVNSFVSNEIGNILAIGATLFEIIFSVCLIIGFKTKQIAFFSGVLLTCFALSMSISFGIKPSLDYSVWTAAAAAFLLSTHTTFQWSLDQFIHKKQT